MGRTKKFGTFGGVFTPSILTILGVIMYLRLPNIVGEAGLIYTIGIILIAHIISATTGLSVSSIATDKKVKAGGTYYMISRSLGLPIGGTLGLALFVGLSFSVSLYLIGFSESFLNFFEFENNINTIRITGTVVLLLVTTITFISTSLALRMQYFIMAAIILSLISIVFGKHDYTPAEPLLTNPTSAVPLMVLFGIFFPAVTGFEAGVSMSGDLEDPKKSIPRGSILAIVVGFVVYILLAFFFSSTVDGKMLRDDPNVLLNISWIKELVVAGIWGATISSALGSILGAPRILQATAVDKITPKVFGKGYGDTNEPRNALILTFIIAEAGILVGELDVIARIVSIFFITTYGFLNLSCAFEAWTSADFRPSFKVPQWVSLLGAAACFIVMIQLDFGAMLGATIILGLLFLFLKRQELTLQSGDAWSGVWSSLVKSGLERLNHEKLEARNWRPNIILFSGSETDRPHLTELGMAIIGRLGMLSSFELVKSEKPLLIKSTTDISEVDEDKKYFHHKHECRDIYEGMEDISRIYGFSGVEPNTILMGWSKKRKNRKEFINLIKGFHRNDYNSLFLNYNRERKFGENRSIDVWWGGKGKNLSLAVNLLRHVTSSGFWKDARIRLLVINQDNPQEERIYKSLERIVSQFRVDIQIKVVNNGIDKLQDHEIIEQESDLTDLTMIEITDEDYDDLEKSYDSISGMAEKLRTTLFINASSMFDEYDLNLTHSGKEEEEEQEQVLTLPDIQYSKYPEIAEDIRKIETHEKKQLELFYNKVFVNFFDINDQVNEELSDMVRSITGNLERIQPNKEELQKSRKLVDKARSEFYYRAKVNYENLLESKIDEQQEILNSGIGWYLNQLDKNIARYPKSLKIKYYKEDLKLKKGEPGNIRWWKIKRRIAHPFAGTMVPGYINYREAAQYFLRDTRYHFIHSLLDQFSTSTSFYYNQVQSLLATIEDQFDKIEKEFNDTAFTIQSVEGSVDLIQLKLDQLLQDQQKMERLYKNRLFLEFRKNVQYFNNELSKININQIVKRVRHGRKFYQNIREENENYSGEWAENVKLLINKNYLELILFSFRDRVYHETESFNQKVIHEGELRFLKPMNEIKAYLQKYAKTGNDKKENKLQKLSGNGEFLVHDFDERGKKLLKIASELPEKIHVNHTKVDDVSARQESTEIVDIPVNRIVDHFLESQYLGPMTETLRKSSETVKNLVFNTNDLIRLTRFNLDNINEETEDVHASTQSIIQNTTEQIEQEEERVRELIRQTIDSNDELLEELFSSISPYKMPERAKELSYLLRGYQSKKVISRFGALTDKTRNLFKETIVRLMYSKSQGILLAQKLAEENRSKSVNEKILDIIDEVSPDYTILDKLPHYYQNLFSGRSNIGENFWIKRPHDEELIKKAIERYQSGIQGGIMVLGERNSGKTSLCLRMTKKNLLNHTVYHVFPSQAGSVVENDFVREVQKSTEHSGSINDIMNAIPPKSVMVFHDLELWWERTNDGLAIIKMIEWVVNEYSYKCLFMFNMNPFAYELINKIYNIEKLFIGVIKCHPFESEELMELIISRHRSSGMEFLLNKKNENHLSEIKLAGLFNDYFDYSEGNPGVALNAWLANIRKVTTREVTITAPDAPSIKALDEIPDDWNVVLLQLIIHKRLSFDQLMRIMELEPGKLGDLMLSLSRSGLIKERSNSVYYLNPFVEPFLIKSFKLKDWL